MKRILEPEIMDDKDQAVAYAHADFSDSNQLYVDMLVREYGAKLANIIDLGCGPADVPIRLVKALTRLRRVPIEDIKGDTRLRRVPIEDIKGKEAVNLSKAGTVVFVMDLLRPDSENDARTIVESVSADENPLLKEDFYNSLLAAFTIPEVKDQLNKTHLNFKVRTVSERHYLVNGLI